MNYSRGTWKGWREGSYSNATEWCSKATCLGMRRGGIFDPKRVLCLVLPTPTSTLGHAVGLTGWDLSVLRAFSFHSIDKWRRIPFLPASLLQGTQGITYPHHIAYKAQRDVSYKGFIYPTCPPGSAIRKAGSCHGYKAAYLDGLEPEDGVWLLTGPAGPADDAEHGNTKPLRTPNASAKPIHLQGIKHRNVHSWRSMGDGNDVRIQGYWM